MATYPTTIVAPNKGTSEEDYIPLIRTESDGNYPKTRRIATKSRKKFRLSYTNMTLADYTTLQTFFIANQGLSFTFTNPTDSISYDCIFAQDSLVKTYQHDVTNLISTQVSLEEV